MSRRRNTRPLQRVPRRLRRGVAQLAAIAATAVAMTLAPVVAAAQAQAAPAPNPPTVQQLAALKADAANVQAQLSAGAKKLDAARARLAQLQSKASAATSAADKLDAELVVLRGQISQFAGDMYEQPTPDMISRMLSGGDINRSVQAAQLLQYASGNRTQVLRQVAVDGQRAKVLRATAAQNVAAAAVVQKSVTQQVTALQAASAKAAARLQAAEVAYQKEQARLAAERAAKAKAARDEAARAEAARRAAALATGQATSVAECHSNGGYPAGPWGGYSDGLIPGSELCAIIGGGRLRPDAAIAFNKMSQAYAQAFGSPICVTDSYRSYPDQVAVFRKRPAFAAVPGTSNHGWGLAVDLGCGIQNYGSAQYRWMTAHAGAFGWVHPAWAVHNPFEPWHWEFGRLGGSGGT
jgi:D-alanyl-D-alanine carboxypeptidase-like protein